VDAEIQRDALGILIKTLTPEILMIPEDKLQLFPPRAYGFSGTRESLNSMTGITFDALAPVASAANFTLSLLLHPERANRLILQHAMDNNLPGLDEVLGSLMKKTIQSTSAEESYMNEVMHTVNFILIGHLIDLANNDGSYPQVNAIVNQQLNVLKSWLEKKSPKEFNVVYGQAYLKQIEENKATFLEHLPAIPPGAPIGMECPAW